MSAKRIVNVSVVPGDPLDGTGRVCIHLFVVDDKGLFTEPHVLHQVKTPDGKPTGEVVARPTKGRLACDRKLNVKSVTKKGVTKVVHRTDDPRGVTCPACIESDAYKSMMAKLKAITEQ